MTLRAVALLEKKIFLFAVLFSVAMLGLIGFAAYRFNLTVPGCVEDMKPFTQSALIKKADGHYELHVVAKMWSFDPPHVDLPLGSTLDIFLTSVDVTHGFHIDGTDVNLMAVPGAINYAQVRFDHPKDYSVVCHEYCGVGHQNMFATLHVSSDVKEAALSGGVSPADPTPAPAGANAEKLALGQKLYTEKGCIACHSLNDAKMLGPNFKGLYGSSVTLSDQSTVTADDAYIAESIRAPQKKIVKGYENIPMPTLPMSDDEVAALTELIKSLR